VIVLNAAGLHTILKSYVAYYTHSRTHLSLSKDSPHARPVSPPVGRVAANSASRRPPSSIRTSRRVGRPARPASVAPVVPRCFVRTFESAPRLKSSAVATSQ
jgi:hypothetical protein